jgi:hypothetical protein
VNKLELIFLSPTNFPHLNQILGTILDGCNGFADPPVC